MDAYMFTYVCIMHIMTLNIKFLAEKKKDPNFLVWRPLKFTEEFFCLVFFEGIAVYLVLITFVFIFVMHVHFKEMWELVILSKRLDQRAGNEFWFLFFLLMFWWKKEEKLQSKRLISPIIEILIIFCLFKSITWEISSNSSVMSCMCSLAG